MAKTRTKTFTLTRDTLRNLAADPPRGAGTTDPLTDWDTCTGSCLTCT